MISGAIRLITVVITSQQKDGAMSNSDNRRGPQFQAAPLITSAAIVGAGWQNGSRAGVASDS
jgi:hypothetical protein